MSDNPDVPKSLTSIERALAEWIAALDRRTPGIKQRLRDMLEATRDAAPPGLHRFKRQIDRLIRNVLT